MEIREIFNIAKDVLSTPVNEIDLSMYSKEEQQEIYGAVDFLQDKSDSTQEEIFLKERGDI